MIGTERGVTKLHSQLQSLTLACCCSAAEFSAQAIQKMEFNVRNVLNDDTAAISTMRCLRLYLERLGNAFLEPCSQHATSGLSLLLVTEALYDTSLLNCRPSVVAAAILYAERRLRGSVPFWPSMLAKLTGYHDMTTPELTVAVCTSHFQVVV
jgi:pentatricopeptide repeat domain-containing protein 1